MLKKWQKCKTFLSALLLVSSASLYAKGSGRIVFDPSNYVKNTITASESVATTITSIKTTIENELQTSLQVKAEYHRMLNLLKYNPNALVKMAIPEELRDLTDYMVELDRMYGDLNNVEAMFSRRMTQYAASGLPWQAWVAREEALAKEEQGDARLAFQKEINAIKHIEEERKAIQEMQYQINAPAGAQQSMQTMNQQLNLLASQNTYILEMWANRGLAESRKELIDAAERKRNAQWTKNMKQLIEKTHQQDRDFFTN